MKNKMPYEYMYHLARSTIKILRPYCTRIVPAGSLRRQRPEIGDIEIVAEPKEYIPDLLGNPTEVHSLDIFDWSTLGIVKINGHKQKKIILPGNVQIDLFIVTPPAQWGVILALRTGSDKFSHRLVTAKSFGGMMPGCYKVKDGAIWNKDKIIPTPQEVDVFKLFGMKFIPPQERE